MNPTPPQSAPSSQTSVFFRDATIITCDQNGQIVQGCVHVQDGLIKEILPLNSKPPTEAVVVPLEGKWLLPGFVQTHVHLVQTLFRGLADDLPLMDWLSNRIWPLEAAHDEDSVYWSARLGATELLLGGTTAILDMATVNHTESVFHAVTETGIRAFIGKAMMDRPNPLGLHESTDDSIKGACQLADAWHGKGNVQYAFAPRFVPSCTETLLRETIAAARQRNCLLHTHASENKEEIALVRELTGKDNIEYLHDLGFTGSDVVLAHCIHLSDAERSILAESGTTVAHCPGSNMKLGSGIAPIPELLNQGVRCTLGADGAPCNNRLDMFAEMRLAALIQKPRLGPSHMPSRRVLEMATRMGAEALGLEAGSIEPGKKADLVTLDPRAISGWGAGEPSSAIVYALTPAAVETVWIGGQQVVSDGAVVGWSNEDTVDGCNQAIARVMARAGIAP